MKIMYRIGRAFFGIFLWLGGVRILGRENIPMDEPLIIISNHISYGDPPAMSWAYPRQITYIAKETFGQNFFTRHIFRAVGTVFLEKESNDMAAMRAALKQLSQGNSIAIYPEGTRHRDQKLGEFKNGAAYIAARAKVRVLPMALLNTGDLFRIWRRNIIVNIGEPFPVCREERVDAQLLQRNTEEYRQRISDLFEEARGILEKEGRPMCCAAKKN
ncbi:MAG: lysophospholipid acyltransferase family protein [Bacillota bacterium]|nr:lysophospholipid acyltransferase family protein [Bacillota bacterium]